MIIKIFQKHPNYIQPWIDLCDYYLLFTPKHKFGFCWWASKKFQLNDPYKIVKEFLDQYSEATKNQDYVCNMFGPAPARLEFVRWMRDQSKILL